MSGVLSMKSQCLPFTQIPHTTRLLLDYLSYTPSVRDFYPRSPVFSEWVKDESRRVTYDDARRTKVSDILARQNHAWGVSPKTLANIDRLRSGDLAEVSHVALLAEHGLPEPFAVDAQAFESKLVTDAPVGTIKFGPEIVRIVDRASALWGDSDIATWLREAYRPGENLGSAFALLFARLFADWGVILLDPADKDFHDLAKPLLRAAIERSSELDDALLARGKAIEAAGYHQQVKVTSATTLLFAVKNGARTGIRRRNNSSNGEEFAIGEEHISRAELLERIENSPEKFNPNVLLRPVVQDRLLPTLAYTGGAAEVAYFAQVGVVYEKLLGRVTPVLPRFSATLLEPKPERILSRYQLSLRDVLQGPDKVREAIAARSLPSELRARFEEAYATVERSMAALRESIGKLDSTLLDTADSTRSSMTHQIDRLRARVARAEELRNEVITRHA